MDNFNSKVEPSDAATEKCYKNMICTSYMKCVGFQIKITNSKFVAVALNLYYYIKKN